MKNNVCLVLFTMLLFTVSSYASDTDTSAPAQVSETATTGVGLNGVNNAVTVGNGSFGINGLSIRLLDAKKQGIEIPVSVQFSNGSSFNPTSRSCTTAFSVASGCGFIFPVFMRDFVRVNCVPGFSAGYTGNWNNSVYYEQSGNPGSTYSTASQIVHLGISLGIEIELPVGKLFSLPPDTLCLAGGITVSGAADYIANYNNTVFNNSQITFSFGTQSFGTTLTGLGIRYYF